MTKYKSIEIEGNILFYKVIYKHQKNMYLKIETSELTVTAPFYVSQNLIENFILINFSKILKKRSKILQIEKKFALDQNPYLFFLNKKLNIKFKYQKTTKFFMTNDTFFIYSPLVLDIKNNYYILVKKLFHFLKNSAMPIFKNRLDYWQKILNIQADTFSIRLMKSKWGVCFPRKKAITLNCRLIHFSYEIIDYVIIHELTHLIHPNHSKTFWNFVRIYCPNYLIHKKTLNKSEIGDIIEKN